MTPQNVGRCPGSTASTETFGHKIRRLPSSRIMMRLSLCLCLWLWLWLCLSRSLSLFTERLLSTQSGLLRGRSVHCVASLMCTRPLDSWLESALQQRVGKDHISLLCRRAVKQAGGRSADSCWWALGAECPAGHSLSSHAMCCTLWELCQRQHSITSRSVLLYCAWLCP